MPAGRDATRDVTYHRWRTATDFAAGAFDGTVCDGDRVVLDRPVGVLEHTDPHTGRTGDYEYGTWTSPPVDAGFPVTELVPSWTAGTPAGGWLRVQMRGTIGAGHPTRWYDLGHWAEDDPGDGAGVRRTSVPGQDDTDAVVDADTLTVAAGRPLVEWQMRVTLLRPAGTTGTPALHSAGAVASRPPPPGAVAPTPPGAVAPTPPGPVASTPAARGTVLAVPGFSQKIHDGHFRQWNGGGASWCSAASTAMVLAYWGTGPRPADYAWVGTDHPDPWVDHAARQCYDAAYDGTGNWPFNTAYAGTFGLEAFVTRLRSLGEAEMFLAAGVPLVVSASFRAGQVPGLDYDTKGHLMVLVGFTADGDPVLNDPYGPHDDAVRRTAGRAGFEAAWLAGSGGLVYVVHPAGAALPPAPAQANW
jgi:hypothetical protein